MLPAADDPVAGAGDRLVLPRALRKPVRHLKRLASGGVRFSRRGIAGVLFAASVMGGSAVLGTGGQFAAIKSSAAAWAGIKPAQYTITGNREVPDTEIIAMITADPGTTIFGYDVSHARETLRGHPWIAEATVSRHYPDTIAVAIDEHPPLAVWQAPDGLKIIGRDGHVLAEFDGNRRGLPLVVGPKANEPAAGMLALMQRYPAISAQTRALVRIGERRWDLELNGGVSVMLPEGDDAGSLARLGTMIAEYGLLERDVLRVDMRMPDRTVIGMSPAGGEAFRTQREEQIKLLSKSARERNT